MLRGGKVIMKQIKFRSRTERVLHTTYIIMHAFRSNTELVRVFQSTGALVPFGIPGESGRNVQPSVGQAYPTPGSLCKRGWPRSPSKGFSRINKLKEKIFYFCCLSVDDNNRSPAVGNDSQNGIHCCWLAAIIYELNQYIVTNNSIAWLYF